MAAVTNGIKSKDRVKEFGEVFTPEKTVKEMCDLVKESSYDIYKTFLEPSCGNGAFLVELIDRKIQGAKNESDKALNADGSLNISEFNLNVLRGVASLYGVDIQGDNIEECYENMIERAKKAYKDNSGIDMAEDIEKAILKIIQFNVVLGNFLTNEQFKFNGTDNENFQELTFLDWKFKRVGSRIDAEYSDFLISDLNTPIGEAVKIRGFVDNLDKVKYTNSKADGDIDGSCDLSGLE